MSGLATPSSVGPRELNSDSRSSCAAAVPWSSSDPTVTTNGSAPGVVTVRPSGPSFPAAATTTTPENQTDSAAAARMSFWYERSCAAPKDRFITRIP